jgi:hypothetical protein
MPCAFALNRKARASIRTRIRRANAPVAPGVGDDDGQLAAIAAEPGHITGRTHLDVAPFLFHPADEGHLSEGVVSNPEGRAWGSGHDPEQSLAEVSRWLLKFRQRTPVCPMSPSYPSRQFDKFAADGLFQVINQRYEHGSTVITTNRAFRQWPEIFNNVSTLTSALRDRLSPGRPPSAITGHLA